MNKIVIEVKGGMVQAVHSIDKLDYTIVDHDAINQGDTLIHTYESDSVMTNSEMSDFIEEQIPEPENPPQPLRTFVVIQYYTEKNYAYIKARSEADAIMYAEEGNLDGLDWYDSQQPTFSYECEEEVEKTPIGYKAIEVEY